MSYPPHGHPPSPWPWPHQQADLTMTLGRLLERSEATIDRLDMIDQRLAAGDARMDKLAQDLSGLPVALHPIPPPTPPWTWQDLKLTIAATIFVLLVLLGKVELAQQVLGVLAGK